MPSYPPAVQEMILRCVQVERNHFPDVRKLVLGVIKKGSKAPDSMLRTMYADLLITKKGL
jgi:hypothetical protein